MAMITEISAQKKNSGRVNLYLDGRFFCGMELDTVVANGLKTGMHIEVKRLAEIQYESEKHSAVERALKYVSAAMKTERQVRDYLKQKGYTEEVSDYAVDTLKGYRYLDDAAYAAAYVGEKSVGKGKKLLMYELMTKGVPRAEAEAALAENTGEAEACRAVAEKYVRNKPRDAKLKARLTNYLAGRGFDYDVIREAVAAVLAEDA